MQGKLVYGSQLINGAGRRGLQCNKSLLHLPPCPAHPAPHPPRHPPQDITTCESEATKKGVQVGAAQKQLDKLGKEATKSQAEKEKMEAQREATMQARAAALAKCDACWSWVGVCPGGCRWQASSRHTQWKLRPLLPPQPAHHGPSPRPALALQEFKALEDAAFQVCAAVEQIKAQLAGKEEELAATRAEYDKKKKEVGWRGRRWLVGLVVPLCAVVPCSIARDTMLHGLPSHLPPPSLVCAGLHHPAGGGGHRQRD